MENCMIDPPDDYYEERASYGDEEADAYADMWAEVEQLEAAQLAGSVLPPTEWEDELERARRVA